MASRYFSKETFDCGYCREESKRLLFIEVLFVIECYDSALLRCDPLGLIQFFIFIFTVIIFTETVLFLLSRLYDFCDNKANLRCNIHARGQQD